MAHIEGHHGRDKREQIDQDMARKPGGQRSNGDNHPALGTNNLQLARLLPMEGWQLWATVFV